MSSKTLSISVSMDPATSRKLRSLEKSLSPQEFKKIARKAMRNIGSEVKKDLIGTLGDRYQLGAVGGFSRIAKTRSRMDGDGYAMRVRGSRIALAKFMTDKGDSTAGNPPSINVVKPRQMQPGDFYARANIRARAKDGVAQYSDMIFRPQDGTYDKRYRLGKIVSHEGRGKIKGLMTVSAPNMMNSPDVRTKIIKHAGERAEKALMKAVDRAIKSSS